VGEKNHTSASQLLNKTNSNKCFQNPESFTSHDRRTTTKCTVISRNRLSENKYTLDVLKKWQSFYMKSCTVHAAQFDANLLLQSFAGCADPLVSMCITTSTLREMHVPRYK
jgi:DNA polymerase III alpha subunit (gram-positive type)